MVVPAIQEFTKLIFRNINKGFSLPFLKFQDSTLNRQAVKYYLAIVILSRSPNSRLFYLYSGLLRYISIIFSPPDTT